MLTIYFSCAQIRRELAACVDERDACGMQLYTGTGEWGGDTPLTELRGEHVLHDAGWLRGEHVLHDDGWLCGDNERRGDRPGESEPLTELLRLLDRRGDGDLLDRGVRRVPCLSSNHPRSRRSRSLA